MGGPIEQPGDRRPKGLADRYIEALNSRNATRVVALFRNDATVEDPVGSPIRRGRAELQAFYDTALSQVLRIEVRIAPRGSSSDACAYAFDVILPNAILGVIGVLTFDEDGLIRTMCAYHGPSDFIAGPVPAPRHQSSP